MRPIDSEGDINIFYIKDLEEKITSCLNALYGVELHKNNFFSFTGTNGKTSSAYLCHQLLINQGHESLYIGTLGVKYNQENINTTFSSKTTPDIFELFYILSHFKLKDAGGGWVMVAANNLSEKSILNALKKGQYYSSTGVEIFEFEIKNRIVKIRCSPSNQVCIVGKGAKSMSKNGKNIIEAEFDLTNYTSEWFRVSIANDSGHFAWTNPVWF